MSEFIGKNLGSYRILEQIGAGGMATIYKAYQPGMDRDVAIKILPPYLAQDEQFIQRFQQEARAIAKLEHAHILPVFDYGKHEGTTYIAMRYVKAGTLKEYMSNGQLPLNEISRIIGQIGSALDYAHQEGIIHRDVKPSNVLIDDQGNTYLTDFGLARMMESSKKFTSSGVSVGTPAYMSPEQGKGAKVDHRSDIYSLGVVLFEMATGQVPFEAETPLAVLLKHITDPLPLPHTLKPTLPEQVERVILRALAKEPADRFQSAGAMAQALETAVRRAGQQETMVAIPTPPAPPLEETQPAEPPAEQVSLITRVQRSWQTPLGKMAMIGGTAVLLVIFGFLINWLNKTEIAISNRQPAEPTVTVAAQIAATAVTQPSPTILPTSTTAVPTDNPVEQARAFADPILAAIANRPPDYADDFSDSSSGWPSGSLTNGSEWGYEDGAYVIVASYPQGCCVSVQSNSVPFFSDFVMELDTRYASEESGAWTVLFREQHGPNVTFPDHFGFSVFHDGSYRIWKNINQTGINLKETIFTPAFMPDQVGNHLTIVAHGSQFAFFLNDEPLWFIDDESLLEGRFSLSAEGWDEDSPLRVQFDNLEIWDISNMESE
jgi:serine/threonine protein kinase